jgi:3-(3-hydroxy-phenyl)propionate hydroxylase
MPESLAADVVIVGLGPVGSVVAGLLAKNDVSVVGLDKLQDVFPLPRAAHIDHTALRTIQEIGCLDPLLADMIENPGIDFVTADGTVLAQIQGIGPNPSNLPASMYFHQPGFDRTVRDTVAALPGVDLRLGVEVTGVEQTADGVVVRGTSDSGAEIEVTGRYVVAADGASSPVREALGIQLIDLEFHERWLVVDLVLHEPIPGLPDRAVTYLDPERPLGFVPMPGLRCRFELMLFEDEDTATMQDQAVVGELVSKWIPVGKADLERSAVYYFHGLVAQPWRAGRVLLAGDAAHQMPPFLGQGMNSGLRDSTNLAWKLARVVRGQSPDSLLDTYELERSPHVRSIVESSVRIGKVVCILDQQEAARRDELFIADPSSLTSTLAFRLPLLLPGALVLEGGGQLATQALSDDGTRRFDDVVGERFLVLARDEAALDDSVDWWTDELGALVATPEAFPEFAASLLAWLDRLRADVVVVRPDRYILAAGQRLQGIAEQLRSVLTPPVSKES